MNSTRNKTRETLTADNILNSAREPSRAQQLGQQPKQSLLIKEEIQNQMVRLETSLPLREDHPLLAHVLHALHATLTLTLAPPLSP